jgi:GT2 family glycosyltransferase
MRFFELPWKRIFRRAYQIIWDEGFPVLAKKGQTTLRNIVFYETYGRWISRYDTLDTTRQPIEADIAQLLSRPIISIIMPIPGDDEKWLAGTIRSVQTQLYPHWELCLAVGHSVPESLSKNLYTLAGQDNRIRIARVEYPATWAAKRNAALKLASGDFVALVEPGDELSERALYWVAKELVAFSDADLIFSDEDKLEREDTRSDPWFKPDWNPALMLSCNAFGRLGVFRHSLLERLGGFRTGFQGAEEYELVLRCARASEPYRIRHIARVLYHCRGATKRERTDIDSREAGRRAIAEHLAIQNIAAEVRHTSGGYRVVYATPTPRPRVSVLITTTARPDLVEPCLQSLFERTSYDNLEVMLLVSERVRQLPERGVLLNKVGKRPNVRIIEYPDRPFNYSWVNNLGATQASGDILCFLNDDTEVIAADWLDQLIARVSLPQVAAAGPMLYYPDGTIQHAGVILGLGPDGIAGHACHHEPRGSQGYFGRACLEQDVSCITAACMAIRADVFRTVGCFDEAMPLAYNDVDLCLRLRGAGWRIIWTPSAELVHHESASLGRHNMGARAEQYARDVALMRRRWRPILNADPFYNRNLSLEHGYKLAFPPRLPPDDKLLEFRQV